MLRRTLLVVLTLLAAGAFAQADPLAPLADWVGGRWVAEVDAGGRKLKIVRTYEWSFDKRLLVGRSFGERDGQPVQTRETVFFWNPEAKRIEFTDFIDNGGFGAGSVEPRDGELYMDVTVHGNPKHPSWRAWLRAGADTQVIRVEALREGKWVDFGTYPYRRER
jgi:hypothetical protein